jgi:hypothetical protein
MHFAHWIVPAISTLESGYGNRFASSMQGFMVMVVVVVVVCVMR